MQVRKSVIMARITGMLPRADRTPARCCFLGCAELDAHRITVEVDGDKVTLRGSAGARRAEAACASAHGLVGSGRLQRAGLHRRRAVTSAGKRNAPIGRRFPGHPTPPASHPLFHRQESAQHYREQAECYQTNRFQFLRALKTSLSQRADHGDLDHQGYRDPVVAEVEDQQPVDLRENQNKDDLGQHLICSGRLDEGHPGEPPD